MGDIPIYVGIDSLDVWSGQENFLLGADGKPTFIAGVPPDYFSATGQRWGNPIYDWAHMKEQDYRFWVDRIGYSNKLFDIIRIDHFRAFDTYWKIPADCPTAIDGEWIEAPGYEDIDTLQKEIPGLDLVAEDLGLLRPEVLMLKDHYHLKGMKILIFSIETGGKYARDTFHDVENMIFYTGTHDNDTIMQWYGRSQKKNPQDVKEGGSITGLCQGQIPAVYHAESGRICDHSVGRYSWTWKRGPYQHTGNHWFSELGVAFTGFYTGQKGTAEIWQTDRGYKAINFGDSVIFLVCS